MTNIESELEIEDDVRSMTPHQKPFMPSHVGRLVERASYLDIAIATAVILLASSFYFAHAPQGWGLNKSDAGLQDALYYSVVTFTTVGYGDLSPVGLGRYVAMALAASGLFLSALLIGKLASERQSALLLLLHTSDTQRRISKFDHEIAELKTRLEMSQAPFASTAVQEDLERMRALAVALKRYLAFNSFQAGIAAFGNASTLASLYEELGGTFHAVIDIMHNTESREVVSRCYKTCKRIYEIIGLMDRHHNHGVPTESFSAAAFRKYRRLGDPSPTKVGMECARLALELKIAIEDTKEWLAKGYHPIQIDRVYHAFPAIPRTEWAKGMHRELASKLGISHSVLSKCVDKLQAQKRLPKISAIEQLLDL
ncbi:potassium channel family protein [Rhizobium chutanense]|uniref:Two pore domain potassium channel family protein n=1 Tax=Rhizobium chutanense TaxID=2035448 RepID=A0A3S0SZ37_9HYPH|nr:potassium channel family protein [Rhizobium chutanense]RUM08308.1 two pore domain potassium channel family protein [Rhizobium chutanense]